MKDEIKLENGIFIISIDFELAWGYVDKPLPLEMEKRISEEPEVVKELLNIFEEYNMPATWAVVGHLLETDCAWKNNQPHSDFPRPVRQGEAEDWFAAHPLKGSPAERLWFDRAGMIETIKIDTVEHEIASHSYAHLIYNDSGLNPEAAEHDIKKAAAIHRANGFDFKTFVFPRNKAGYLKKLKEAGISSYRGHNRRWYDRFPLPLSRVGHLADYFLPGAKTVKPTREENGLINIPDCLLLVSRNGFRKIVSPGAMVKKAKAGLRQAAMKKEIFHLWFHPFNFLFEKEKQFKILKDILTEAYAYREKGEIDIITMGEVAMRYR
jgi:peptidoglycan/xylan/chitin deacetylase (PgdA/CDA1 family)